MPYWIIGLDKWIPPIEKQSPASSHEGLVLISIVMVCLLYMVKRSLLHIYIVLKTMQDIIQNSKVV